MKVGIIGPLSGEEDEGFRNVTARFVEHLGSRHDLLPLDVGGISSPLFWKKMRDFSPDVVHYMTAPTFSSFLALKAARALSKNDTKLVMSALHPNCLPVLRNPVVRTLIPRFPPDLIVTQSPEAARLLKETGARVRLLPHGVDTVRFRPVPAGEKGRLREKYDLDREVSVLLHVGHVKPDRGLGQLLRLQQTIPDCQVVIVGSPRFARDRKYAAYLREHGCIVMEGYYSRIEELYQLADCYVFPRGKTLFLPLTVMEAMACNLPVVTAPFDGVMQFFPEGKGLFVARSGEEYSGYVRLALDGRVTVTTREKVLPCSWGRVADEVSGMYQTLCGEKP
ncbi:glycosyltransferase family 4 protein [Methanofollis sp. UBA420]|uniref:glycosyltransferase family 4 protein n=1 Tax=Methanofollis sp. UBA420 TaxID=1915514 RepID=UPI00316AE6E5